MGNIVVLSLLFFWLTAAVVHLRKARRSGKCIGCTGCGGGCRGCGK